MGDIDTELTGAEGPARDNRHFIQSVDRGLAVLKAFDAGHPRLTLEEAAARSGISRSATRRLLRTLVSCGYAEFDGRHFLLTPRLLELGYAQQARLTLPEIALPHCESLSRELDRTVALAVLDGADVTFLLRCGTHRIISVSLSVGSRLPAHLTAIGRAILAWLPEDELEAYLAQLKFTSSTTRTINSVEDFRASLLAVRADGFAVVEQELEEGLRAIAAPVRDRRGRVVAAVNVSSHDSGRSLQRQDLPSAAPALLRTTARIGLELHPSHVS